MDQQQPLNIAETPPYWQPRSELMQSQSQLGQGQLGQGQLGQNQQGQNQLAEMRARHERESAKMSEEMRVAHNREMGRLAAAGRELERNQQWQEDYEKTQERRANWMSWFQRTNKEEQKEAAPSMVSRIGGSTATIR